MTEDQWLEANDPNSMLDFLWENGAGERKIIAFNDAWEAISPADCDIGLLKSQPWNHARSIAWELDPPRTQQRKCSLLRCLFGNPLMPTRPNPSWQTPNAVTMAQTIYDERRWELLPLLADLLEEAGCPKQISDHCRGEGPHARGCWVVDLVLGKE